MDLTSNTALSLWEANMQRMLLKGEERKANEVRQYARGSSFAWELIGSFKVRQRSTALRLHEDYLVTHRGIQSVFRA